MSLANLPMRMDPLLAIANLVASRIFVSGSLAAIFILLLTIVFGRSWCGWLCPLGTILDIFSLKKWQKKDSTPREGWRRVKFDFVIVIFIAAILGNLTLLFFDPLTLLQRFLTVSVWPAIDRIITPIEIWLGRIPALAGPLYSMDSLIRPAILPIQPVSTQEGLLFAFIFIIVILLNILATRFWCRYLCPLGGLLGYLSKMAVFRRQVEVDCKDCKACVDICPTGTIDATKGYASNPSECTMCLECLEGCALGKIRFAPELSLDKKTSFDPDAKEALLAAGATVAAIALLKSTQFTQKQYPFLIRPPGVRETNQDVIDFTKCTRCNECIRVCPTGGLQPAVFEGGVTGLGSPMLVPRLGCCDYSCNACGQICPVQAIPPLSLETKQVQVIGHAYINQNRCIPWSDHKPCLVCEEMCPVPEKAIQLETVEVWGADNKKVVVKLPHVLRELCIGCGICEYKCPVSGEAAIRIYIPTVVA